MFGQILMTKLVSVATLLMWMFTLALPPATWAQPGGGPAGPPAGGSASTPLAFAEVNGQPEGTYSRFYIAVYPSPDGTNTMDIAVPSSMPDLEVSAYVQQPWGEELALSLQVETPAWTAMSVMHETLEPFTTLDFENLTPAEEQSLGSAVESMLASLDTSVFNLAPGASDMLSELVAAAQVNGLVAAGGAWASAGCASLLVMTAVSLGIVVMTQYDLIRTIFTSPITCVAPEPTGLTKIICGVQVGLWGTSMAGTGKALFYLAGMGVSFLQFSTDIAQDQVGESIDAGQANAARIARSAKDVESSAREVWEGLGVAGGAFGTLAMLSFAAADVFVGAHATFSGVVLGLASTSFGLTHGCVRNVIPPRLQASVIRNRMFLQTDNGLVDLPVNGANVITALPRHLAKNQVIEIDADVLLAQNPAWLPAFDELNQRQDLEVLICEGVVIGADPDPLAQPPQQPGTDYWIGDLGSGGSCLSKWWLGLAPTRTNMGRKHHAATVHRACESGGLIDNNNDSWADASATEYCTVVQSQPPGEIEEDLARVPVNVDIHGPTMWSTVGGDMLCNAGTLSLVSRDGSAGRSVRQEYVANTASCWTDEGGTQVSAYHPHDSTQIRFALSDSDWGEPRPRGCFDWDAVGQRWECNGNAGCPCNGNGNGPGAPPMP